MNAFETLIGGLLRRDGIWVYPSYRVLLSKEEKREIGKPSLPRPEIDVLGYQARDNRLLWIECKSYLDSHGVSRRAFDGSNAAFAARFKVFTDAKYRRVASRVLLKQVVKQGLVPSKPRLEFWLIAGHIAPGSRDWLEKHFSRHGWELRSKDWIVGHLTTMSSDAHEDDAAMMVAKLMQ